MAKNSYSSTVFPTESVALATTMPQWRESKARTLHLINGEHYSGAERVQDLLAMQLPKFDYQVGFACVKPGKFPETRVSDCPLYMVPMKNKTDLGMLQSLQNVVERDKYDIIHAHTPRTAVYGSLLARATGLPLVYHVHSPVGRDSTRYLQNWINGQMERLSLAMVKRLITVSHSLGEYMKLEGHDETIISVVPNGVPCTDQRRNEKPPSGAWTLGTVALFRPRKGTEILLDAAATLRNNGQDVRVLCVGGFESPGYEQQLKDQVCRLNLADKVEWTGFTRDVNSEFQRMDLFVLPSLFGEGLPMVVLEAMAAGVPVVGTKVEGVPEAIREGVDGVLANPSDATDLATQISRIVDGSLNWVELRQSALQRHAELFSDESMARGVAGAYDAVFAR